MGDITELISKINKMLQEYVDAGGDVNTMPKTDKCYTRVVDALPKFREVYGDDIGISFVFEKAGFPRQVKKLKNQEEVVASLKQDLDDFVNNGGDVYSLTRNDKLYRRVKDSKILADGRVLTLEEKFEFLGHKRVSVNNNYIVFAHQILGLERFQDKDGFVDSYRKDQQANDYVDMIAKKFGMSPSAVIILIGNYNLKSFYVNVNKQDYVFSLLVDYLNKYGSFESLKTNDKKLYELLRYAKRVNHFGNGLVLSTKDYIDLLGLGDYYNNFKSISKGKVFLVEDFLKKYRSVINKNDGVIYRSQIEDFDYYAFSFYARRMRSSIIDILAKYGVGYNGHRATNNSYVEIDEYPYLEEMRKARNRIMKEFCDQNPNAYLDKQNYYKKYFEACGEAYREFYPKVVEKLCTPSSEQQKGE